MGYGWPVWWMCLTRTCCCLGPDFYLFYLMGVAWHHTTTQGNLNRINACIAGFIASFYTDPIHHVVEKVSSSEVGGMTSLEFPHDVLCHPVRESSPLEIIGCLAVCLTNAHWLVACFSFLCVDQSMKLCSVSPLDGVELRIYR